MQTVGPGDVLLELPATGQVRVGAGIQPNSEDGYLVASRAGVLKQTKAGKVWIEGRLNRYIPAVDDAVVGIIKERYGESWTLDIRGPFPATLPALAFEGVTRRNRPRLEAKDVVYAKVTNAPRDADTELTCVLATGKSGGFGELKGGTLVECDTACARKLLSSPPCPILAALGSALQFELAVGQNGRIWVKAKSTAHTILVANAIQKHVDLPKAQAEVFVRKAIEGMQSSG